MSTSVEAIAKPEDEKIANMLAKFQLFVDLPQAVLSLLSENSDCRQYSAGQTVLSQGQYVGDEFFLVQEGKIRVSLLDPSTGSMMIEDFRENTIFGLEVALSELQGDMFQRVSVTAEDNSRIIAMDAESFRTLASGRPTLMRSIALHFAGELSSLRFKTMTTQTAPERKVFSVLLEYVKRDPLTGLWRIGKMPKHRELADRAGVEEAQTASAVAALIQEGVAKRDYPGLIINDMHRLNQLAS